MDSYLAVHPRFWLEGAALDSNSDDELGVVARAELTDAIPRDRSSTAAVTGRFLPELNCAQLRIVGGKAKEIISSCFIMHKTVYLF